MKIKLSKSQWEGIGKKAGWTKKAYQSKPNIDSPSRVTPSPTGQASFGAEKSIEVTMDQIQQIKDYAVKIGLQVKDTPNGFEVEIPI